MIRRLRHIGTPNYPPRHRRNSAATLLARLIYGGRLSLLVGILPVILAFIVGEPRSASSPAMSVARSTPRSCAPSTCSTHFLRCCWRIAISGVLGAGIVNSIVSLTVVFVPQITRRCRERPRPACATWISSKRARASGAGPFTIMRVHMLGNVLGPIFVYATGLISVSMILAAGPVVPRSRNKNRRNRNGGLMLNTLRTAIYVNPWGGGIARRDDFSRVSICFNLLSDGNAQRHGHPELTLWEKLGAN